VTVKPMKGWILLSHTPAKEKVTDSGIILAGKRVAETNYTAVVKAMNPEDDVDLTEGMVVIVAKRICKVVPMELSSSNEGDMELLCPIEGILAVLQSGG